MLIHSFPSFHPPVHHPIARFALMVLAGAVIGSVLGYIGQCTSGTCPLTSTWWRGALYGGALGLMGALTYRTG